MMEQETIIKGLEIERECVSRDCDRDCGKCDLVQDRDWLLSVYDGALKLLKEQEPIEPTSYMDGYVQRFACGKCGKHLLYATWGRDNFCSKCGREVKWE